MDYILFALWFFLPAGLSNGAPVIANRLPLIKNFTAPLDFGRHFRGKRIFGDNKRWRGLLFGTFVASMVVLIQSMIYENSAWIRSVSLGVDYSSPYIWLLGALLGFGALAGDAIESFIKRQLNIPSGESWFPLDQIDYILGGMFFLPFFVSLSLQQYLVILLVWFSMHVFWTYVFYLLGFRDKPI